MANETSDVKENLDLTAPAEGSSGAELQEEKQTVEAPAFDPSKIDVEDSSALARLSDEEMEKVSEYNRTKGASPEAGAEKATPAKDTEKDAAAAAAEKAAESAPKYAGKYATADELVKGVSEIGKKLGVDVSAFVEAAQDSKEFKSLESLYKRLEKTLSVAAQPHNEGQPGAQPAPFKDTAKIATPEDDPEIVRGVTSMTLQQLATSNLAARMTAKGLSLPKTMEEFDALSEVSPYFAMEFKQVFQDIYKANMAEAKGYLEAEKSVEGSNASVIDTDTRAIKAFAEENGFKLTDEDMAAAKSAALANPASYESRYGVRFLRSSAIRDHFMANMLPSKIQEIKLSREAAGRAQAIQDLEKAKKREVTSVGTSSLGTKTRAVQKMPDLNDPAVIASLPDEALNDPEGYFRKQGFK